MLAVGATPPPQIYHIVTRPLCAELHEHIAPAIGMMLQNDTTIKKSPALFKQIQRRPALYGSDPIDDGRTERSGRARSRRRTSNPSQNMALQGMENLIRPIANNIIAIQTMLDSPELRTGTGRPEDDQRLQDIRDKLLKALATQNASLDIISGFVDTQQMADLQHAGEAYISSITQPDTSSAKVSTPGAESARSEPELRRPPAQSVRHRLGERSGLDARLQPRDATARRASLDDRRRPRRARTTRQRP